PGGNRTSFAHAAPASPRFSRKAVTGATLTGLSLALPFLILCAGLLRWVGLGPVELALGLASVMLLGASGAILCRLGLSEIRSGQGRIHGLPLAVFATLTWPVLVLGGVVLGVPFFTLYLSRASGGDGPSLVALAFTVLLPVGTLTFVLWAIHATVRWASGQPVAQRRGVLKWVFAGLLLAGMGIVILSTIVPRQRALPSGRPEPVPETAAAASTAPGDFKAAIQFTFTAVEVREDEGARWLAMDFVQQARGECERT